MLTASRVASGLTAWFGTTDTIGIVQSTAVPVKKLWVLVMWKLGPVVLLVLALSGCASVQLKHSTLRSASTLTDLQYQQVLNNLAMYCETPTALPWHVNLQNGAVQVADAGSIGTIAQSDLSHAFTWSPYFTGTRSIVTQWSTIPVTDDTTLRLLRQAYQIAENLRPVEGNAYLVRLD